VFVGQLAPRIRLVDVAIGPAENGPRSTPIPRTLQAMSRIVQNLDESVDQCARFSIRRGSGTGPGDLSKWFGEKPEIHGVNGLRCFEFESGTTLGATTRDGFCVREDRQPASFGEQGE
jgi:hypothetical protein